MLTSHGILFYWRITWAAAPTKRQNGAPQHVGLLSEHPNSVPAPPRTSLAP